MAFCQTGVGMEEDLVDKPILSAAEVVSAARGWIGTRFHHQGRVKASAEGLGGCDCLGLLVGVAGELHLQARGGKGLLADFDERSYGHLPDGQRLQAVLRDVLLPIAVSEMRAGDVVLFRLEREPQHLAMVSDYAHGGLGLIHALAQNRRVVEHGFDALWRKRVVEVYRLPQLRG